MKSPASKAALLFAATVAFSAVPATAQTTTDGTGNSQMVSDDGRTVTTRTTQTEDHDFPWGLLGLLGLAGLLPKKRREPDIHVDARRDTSR